MYFSAAWQDIEERNASTQITTQYVWSPVYVDAMILRDRDFDGDGLTDERMYALQDANWNVTALVDTQGDVMERFTYDAYGERSALTENWFPTTSFQYGHQGGKIDAVTGRINFRNRDYDTDLMRWVQQVSLVSVAVVGFGRDVGGYFELPLCGGTLPGDSSARPQGCSAAQWSVSISSSRGSSACRRTSSSRR